MTDNTQQLPDELQQQIESDARSAAQKESAYRVPSYCVGYRAGKVEGATEWALKYWQTNLEKRSLLFSNAQYETYTEELRNMLERLRQENEKLRQRIDSTLREERKKLQAELTKIDVDWATRYHGLEVKHEALKEKAEKMAQAIENTLAQRNLSSDGSLNPESKIWLRYALSNYNSEKEGKP